MPAAASAEPSAAPAPADALVRVRGLSKRYGDEPILREVSLHIRAGEMVGLMGRSGSGKSTLLHVLGGLDREYEGTVEVVGADLKQLSDRALSRLRNEKIGFVFQSFHLLDHLSCLENVLLPNAFAHAPLPAAQAQTQAREALSRVGLGERAASRPAELSGGQKQRVAIARALFYRPVLLLCDEPTGNLDAHTGQQIIDLFRALHRDGLTLLLVTHEPRVAEAAQRLLHLDGGRLVAEAASAAEPPP